MSEFLSDIYLRSGKQVNFTATEGQDRQPLSKEVSAILEKNEDPGGRLSYPPHNLEQGNCQGLEGTRPQTWLPGLVVCQTLGGL